MFKNKHTLIALIVTPFLAIAGYFATDYLVSERPEQALVGGQYLLVQSPNCRYASGKCELKNGNFKIIVKGKADDSGTLSLRVESMFALDEAYVSVVRDPSDVVGPSAMLPGSDNNMLWQAELQVIQPKEQYLRVVVTVDGSAYYAETTMAFLDYETSFNKDFRNQ